MMRRVAFALAFVAAAPAVLAASVHAEEAAQETAQEAEDTARMNASAKVVQRALDAWRARNFEGWIANYGEDVVIRVPGATLVGREEMRLIYEPMFQARIPDPKILESGWTGERVYVRQMEYLDKLTPVGVSYVEYEVRNGKIIAVYGMLE
jgi:hypothetical protein